MKQAFFWCYPWDIEDEGTEAALGRMAGDIGLDAVSVATTCRDVKAFRARAVSGPKTIERDAAAHFRPDGKCYVNTRLRPVAASWMKSRNPLEKIAREADKQGLKLRAWTVCCHGSAMLSRYPTASCTDLFGDPSSTWLCPSNPDVREYVAALAEDLSTNYPLEAVELMDFGFSGLHVHRYVQMGFLPGDVETTLLGWCFCSSCRQRAMDAGIDVEAVVGSATGHIDRMLRVEQPLHASFQSLLADDDHLSAYHRMRVDAVTSLLRMVRSRTRARLLIDVPSVPGGSRDTGVEPAEMGQHCDGFLLPFPRADAPDERQFFGALVKVAGGADRIDVSMACCPPGVKDAQTLVAQVHRASREGCRSIGFFNYGLAPEPCLDWVRQAVRFARRESEA
ncbi:MAG: hypothetical protein JXQ75_14915 [Phycisphaerae bacterium]|nr:hypothetical protein [Phycisphaerae bacterium]